LAHISIISAVEEAYNLQFMMPEMLSIKTIADLYKLMENHGAVLVEE
jgi:acyl carrier protein